MGTPTAITPTTATKWRTTHPFCSHPSPSARAIQVSRQIHFRFHFETFHGDWTEEGRKKKTRCQWKYWKRDVVGDSDSKRSPNQPPLLSASLEQPPECVSIQIPLEFPLWSWFSATDTKTCAFWKRQKIATAWRPTGVLCTRLDNNCKCPMMWHSFTSPAPAKRRVARRTGGYL